jgi:dipeptidyl aminopeptidase/acylaminoacyl peptidase
MDRLAERSKHARRLSMGQTSEGREIPVITFANPPVATAAEAAAARQQGKLVVLLFGNIHAGEVDAKEALLMLARELAGQEDHPLLANLVIAIAPIYNADGNEQFGPIAERRPGQAGPEAGAGQRHNAQDLDLNRDFVKLEAPETRALVRFMRQWDPAIVMDGHTTNGSLHRFLITYAGPKMPAGDAAVISYSYEKLLPGLTQAMKQNAGIDTFLYGNFQDEHARWSTFPAEARYGTNYIGLRNRLSVLSESYAYASYEDRIRGTLAFSREILNYASEHKEEIRNLLRQADERATAASGGEVALRTEAVALPEKGTALGFVETRVEGQRRPVAGEPREYEVEILDKWQATHSVSRPFAYLLPVTLAPVIENLQRHGIQVEELREDIDLDVTEYTLDEVTRAERPFQGHALVRAEATPSAESRRVLAGTIVVRTNQPLGALAAFLLEPESEDGLVAWNFLDEAMEQGKPFPVARLEAETPLLTTAVRPLQEERTMGKIVSYEVLYGGEGGGAGRFGRGGGREAGGGDRPSFGGAAIGGLRWIDDDHYLQNKDRRLHKVNAITGASEVFMDPAPMTEALAKAGISERAAAGMAGRARWTDDYARALVEHENDLYAYSAATRSAVRLTTSEAPEELAELSPDGRFVSFVRANDLYVVDVDTQQERALTTGGTDILRNGKADWIYFEELFGRNWKAYWWSPDSSAIAFLQTDSSMVDSYTLTNDLEEPQEVETVRYPEPGTPNPHVKLGIVSVTGGEVSWVNTGQYPPEDFLISGVGWWPDGSRCYFFGQNREQTWLDVNAVGREGGTFTTLLRDKTEAWIEPQGGPWFLADGSFLMVSDRSGWRHLYRFGADGTLMNAVTEGEWDVRGMELIDEKGGVVYVNGTKDSHIATNLYRASLDGSEITRLTKEPGSHSVTLNPSGTRYIDSWSSRTQPTKVALYGTDGQMQRMLDTNPVYSIEEWTLGAQEQFQIETEDGFLLEAALVKPASFDPARKYPIWITTYAGPYAPTIRDSWGAGNLWDQMLANEGIVVMRVDPRPASGKGPKSAWTAYHQLGVQETQDLVAAVEWLEKQPWADTSRVGLSGHSYGGYITAYAMTHSDKFTAGIAGAPVTDWRDYDSIYTERYMGTPQSNPAGYARSSAVAGARNLHGELLLVHGAIDDNVHPQNTIRMARALQEAGKPFEMMIYPGARHGIGGRHYTRLQYDFIRRTMGVDGQESIRSPGDAPPRAEGAGRRRDRGSGSTGAAPSGAAGRQE